MLFSFTYKAPADFPHLGKWGRFVKYLPPGRGNRPRLWCFYHKGVSIVAQEETKMGRPTVMTEAVVSKLELGFMKGLNVTECCHYADISRNAFYEFLKKNPDFEDRIEELRSTPSAKAKLNIAEAIENGDTDLSKWWLERRNKDEFSTKQEVAADVQSEVTINIELVDE